MSILALVFAQVIWIFIVEVLPAIIEFYVIAAIILFSYAALLMVYTIFFFSIEIENNNIRFRKGRGKKNILFIIGTEMFIIMVTFLTYAINHPEGSFPISLELTRLLYLSYITIMISCFIVAIIMKIIGRITQKNSV